MRIVQWKRSGILRLAVTIFILLPLLYLLLHAKETSTNSALPHQEKLQRFEPFLTKDRGNFEPEPVPPKEGPGEGGKPYSLHDDQANLASQSLSEYGMNIACSDEISLERSIPDTRLSECKHWNYPEDLPKASVIIVFHNEGWSTLMRTVHTVIKRTPPQFLEEVLLVDDFSDKDNLKDKLNDYIERFDGKVRLIRNAERQGLIRTRSRGAEEARGEVIVFLDAHCEVNIDWLPPLLTPIYNNRRTMTVPVIDGIDHDTFEYRPVYQNGRHYRGIFEWGMLYKENELGGELASADGRKYNSEPYKSPTHAGGLFAMDRKYFLELGAYDPGLLVWGGENFELSFKIWQCGGSIYWVPCSRVGHVYRGFMPYTFGKLAEKKKGPLITINYKRVIETWFDDEYKQYFYTREPLAKFLDMGNISDQLALKERLHCKPFKWFMENIAMDLLVKFPPLPPNLHWGELQNSGSALCLAPDENDAPTRMVVEDCMSVDSPLIADTNQLRNAATQKCLDTMGKGPPALMGISQCHGFGNNQLVRLNSKGQMGIGERCVDADRQGIKLVFCRLGTVDGPWQYDKSDKTLYHTSKNKCLALHPQTSQLSLMACKPDNAYQQWTFKEIHPKWR